MQVSVDAKELELLREYFVAVTYFGAHGVPMFNHGNDGDMTRRAYRIARALYREWGYGR